MLAKSLAQTFNSLSRPSATFLLASSQRTSLPINFPQRSFRQVNNLHEIVYTAQSELA